MLAKARFLLLTLGVGLILSACGGSDRTPLVLYSPHGRDLLKLIEDRYEILHPEIDVRWLDMGTQEVFDRILSEKANPQADVWFGGPSSIFARATRSDILAPFTPSWSSAVASAEKDPAGYWSAIYRTPTLIVYNSDVLSAEEAPADWPDLLDERWRDQIVIRDPLASGTMRTIFGYLLFDSERRSGTTAEGFEYLTALDGQTREYVHSPALMQEKLIRQEGLVSLWEMTDILNQIARGAPLGYRFPESGAPVIPDSVALVKGAKHPEVARAFVEWLGSQEALQLAAEGAFRLPAVALDDASKMPEWALSVARDLVPADVDWQRLEEQGPDWMAQWDRSVRGRGK
jgi:iron(III) transport system substrate-binding protein